MNRNRKGVWELVTPIILPFMLSLFPFAMLNLGENTRERLRQEDQRSRWEDAAMRRVETFRSMSSFGAQIEMMGRDLGKLLERQLRERPKSGVHLDAALLRKSFETSFPASHRAPGTLLYGCSIDPDGKTTALCGTGFALEKVKIITDLLGAFLYPNVSSADRKALDSRCVGLFGGQYGPLYRFDILADTCRKRLTPITYGGKRAFMLWSPVTFNNRILGAFLIIFPCDAPVRARPLNFALRRIAGDRRSSMTPVLMPFFCTNAPLRAVVAPGHSPPHEARPFISAFFHSGAMNPGFSEGQLYATDRVWLLRDFISLDIPYELWISSKPHLAHDSGDPLPFLWGTSLAAVWIMLFARILIFGSPLSISLRLWFAGFFLLVGALPLSVFVVNGSIQIETSIARERNEIVHSARAQFERIDTESAACLHKYTALCRSLMADKAWRKNFIDTHADRRHAAEEAIARFRSAGLALDGVIAFMQSSASFFWPNDRRDENMGTMRFWQPMMDSLNLIFQPDSFSQINEGPISREIFNLFFGAEAGIALLPTRGQGDLIQTSNYTHYIFYDILAERGSIKTNILMRANIDPAFRAYLTTAIRRLNYDKRSNARYAVGHKFPGGQEPIYPLSPEGNLWESIHGRFLRRAMDLTARTSSFQSIILEDFAIIAYPCRKTEGYVLGAILPIPPLTTARLSRYFELILFTGVLGLPILLLGAVTVHMLLNPLRRVEKGLIMAAQGDLSVRLHVERDDEFGDLTKAFDGMIAGLGERRKLGRFVSGTLDATISTSLVSENAPPREVYGVVLVSDLRSFTTISESHSVREVTSMLNRHLETMSSCIQEHDGLIDKFIGDAIVATFMEDPEVDAEKAGQITPPLPDIEKKHADARPGCMAVEKAMRAAMAMTGAWRRLNDERHASGLFTYEMGVGIDDGRLIIGTLTSSGRLEHTILGEPRTNAEYLESLSRNGRHTHIVVSPAVAIRFPTAQFSSLNDGSEALELISLPEMDDVSTDPVGGKGVKL
ncbi:MAG: adenylate/guanylate cyclase domain-containing protein [Candidatus Riflebacteria bacterium]|nr:adenylate/guanylate cyclase domain-containing protein [Candidatus Riflebacteria bacterium]